MPKTLSQAIFLRLSHSTRLIDILQNLHHISGMMAVFSDSTGKAICTYPREPHLGLCRILRDNNACEACCVKSIAFPYSGLNDKGCLVGLKEIMHTLSIEGHHIGSLSLTYFRDKNCDEQCKNAWITTAKNGCSIPWIKWNSEWKSAPELSEVEANAYLHFLHLSAEELLKNLNNNERALPNRMGILPNIINKACEHIRAHYAEMINLKEVAQYCNVSPEYLSRLFRQTTKLKLQDYLTETRLNKACNLLKSTNLNIATIASQVGYSTLSRFNHNFKCYIGMTPSRWRKQNA